MSNFSKSQMGGGAGRLQAEMERAFARLDAERIGYEPADASVWAGTPPSTLAEAVSRIALHVSSGAGTAPIVELT
jgi:hypothetical protein